MSDNSTDASETPQAAPSRADRARGSFFRFFLAESLVVVLSVLAALAVDRWTENRARHELAAAAMADVVDEVRQNLAELVLTDSISHFRLDSLGRMAAHVDNSRPLLSYAPPGFYTPDLNRAAWERLSRSSGEFRVPASFSNDAFRFYRGVEMLHALELRVQDIYFGPMQHRAEDARVSLEVSRSLMQQQLSWGDFYQGVAVEFLETWDDAAMRSALAR